MVIRCVAAYGRDTEPFLIGLLSGDRRPLHGQLCGAMGPSDIPLIVNSAFWLSGSFSELCCHGLFLKAKTGAPVEALISIAIARAKEINDVNFAHSRVIQAIMVITAVCCYTFWLGPFMMQYHPLIGPQLDTVTAHMMYEEWK
ncbi:hypothetical protein V5799_017389 [Amblyomma americanum]|uniref:Uncharacterized protein n=1 Tax=Amblyomma americanum TaxID=6943 RepID=A0AAQ4F293_AMBAM